MAETGELSHRLSRLQRRWERSLLGHAVGQSNARDLGTHTLALSAQLVLCLAPLVVAVSSILRRFRAGSAGGMVGDLLGLTGQSAQAVRQLMDHAGNASWGALLLGLAYGLVFTTGVAATTQRLLETIWELPRTPWRQWWTQWALLVGQIGWRRLLPGAVATAIGCGLVSATSTIWVPDEIVEEVTDYGLIGATFVLSLWIFILATVFVIGVSVSKVWDERHPVRGQRLSGL